MRSFLLLAVFALAVTALPQLESLPGHDFPGVPPETDFTEVVAPDEEAHATMYDEATQLLEQKGKNACQSLADAAIQETKSNIAQEQAILNKIDSGAKCPNEGQGAITAAQNQLKKAEDAKKAADKAHAGAKAAKVNFGDFTFSNLSPGNCNSMFGGSAYTTAKAKVDAAAKTAAAKAGEVTGAKSGVQTAKDQAAIAVKKCQCTAYKNHEKALAAANQKTQSANKAAWTKGYHLKCVLAGTPASSCKVPSMPKVNAVKLASGVNANACGGGSHTGMATFPLTTGKGTWPQSSSGGNKVVKVTGDNKNGYNFNIWSTSSDMWYRGAFGPWKINKSDLPVTLSWDWTSGGVTSSGNNNAMMFLGFDYVQNDKQNAWYDCTGDWFMRCRPNENMYEYLKGCSPTHQITACNCGTSGKLEIKISKAGQVSYHRNGQHCYTSKEAATNRFPLYVSSSLYGGKSTIKNLKLQNH